MALGTRSVVSPWGLVPCKRNRPCNGSANSLGHVCHPLYATDSISWSNHQVRARLASKALCNLRVKSSMVYPHWKCQLQSYQKISELLVDAPNRLSRPRSQEFRLSFLDQLRTQHSTNTVTNGKIRKWPNVVKDGSYSNRKQIDLSDGISNTTENSDVKNDATRLSDALCGVRQSYTRRKRVAATQVSRQTSMSISKQGMEVQRVNNYFTEGLHTLPSHDGLPLHEQFGILYEDITIPANGVSFNSDGVTKASWEEEKKFEYSPGNAWLRESAKIRKQLFTSEIKAVTKTLDLEDMDLHMEDISRQQKESHLNAPEPGSFIPCNEVAQPVKECQAKKKKSSKQRAVDMGVSGVKTIETKTALQKSASKKTKDVFNETMISDCLNMVNEKCIDISITSEEAKTDEAYENKKVLIIEEVSMAEAVVKQLMEECRHLVHACDTEVSSIDVMKESPVNHGNLICFSIYCGPDVDFGNGKSRIWVDVLKGGEELLQVFKHYFEDSSIRKVWHNYSFDKHILANYGIEASGFYADTMHLARLWDSARRGSKGGYSLEALTSDPVIINSSGLSDKQGKTSMKELFGQPNTKKDGSQGKLRVVPPVEELQETQRDKWIHYSAHDAVCTWHLWRSLQMKLEHTPWVGQGDGNSGTMYDFYVKYWAPFGSLLVQMEADGMLVDRDHLAKIEKVAIEQKDISTNRFRKWAARYCPDAVYMNVCSDAQIRQLLFGGISNRKDPSEIFPFERTFKVPNTENYIEKGAKTPKKQRSIVLAGIGVRIPVDSYTSSGWPAVGGASIKALAGKVAIDYTCLEDDEEDSGDISLDFSDSPVLLTSGGIENDGMAEAKVKDLSIYGKAYDVFGGGKEGEEACMAFAALCELTSIDTLISNFIQPLQGDKIAGQDGRVHCSLNINTETGRLSARRPNLQNQPALEKDRYKIRQAFVAAPGKSLIVADYGQLELRILAHLTNCKSMLEAFEAGGDFHSRTAMNMYPHVEKAVKDGTVLLEWDAKPGESTPPAPLLKDMFASERRKAKMLNFSIAYGKTAMGLANDWKVSKEEAQRTLELWYNDRIEVKNWQANTIKEARKTKHVYTLLGRSRHLPEIASQSGAQRGHAERAAINTPVQGSAADVAMCAMLEINKNPDLQKLGWKLILQVHDEVILEGPTESAQEAMHLVVDAMSHPFNGKNFLKVKLDVAAKYAESWYAAK